jgi:cytochrome c-type biogenesis protein CcmH
MHPRHAAAQWGEKRHAGAAPGTGVFPRGRIDYGGRMIWVLAAAMAVMAAALLARAAQGAAPAAEPPPDARVYRDQLKEIARDAARGVIPADEAQRLRAEVARRLIAADRPPAPGARGPLAPLVAAAGLMAAGALGTYAWLGAPGYPDLPMRARLAMAADLAAARPSQAMAEAAIPAVPLAADAEFLALMAQLRARMAERPGDLTGQRLLAGNEARLGNLAAARAAQARVVAILGAAATPDDRATLARLMVAAAGGTVTPEAEAVLAQVLAADDAHAEALFLAGIGQMQVGRPDLGFRLWRRYLEVAPADSPWRGDVAAQMQMLAAAAGVDWVPPAAQDGPTAADLAAAAEMTAEERLDMAAGMVARLEGRLAAEGGPAADWARLITALGVLGQSDRARAIYAEAATAFAGRDADLSVLAAAARQAGVAE